MLNKCLWQSVSEFANSIGESTETLYHWKREGKHSVKVGAQIINGKPRDIAKPYKDFKFILKKINKGLKTFELPDYIYSSPKGKSHVQCALTHLNSPFIFRIDLKDYYPSTRPQRVKNALRLLTSDPELLSLLTQLCTHDFQLPQGFPTSQTLGDLILVPVGERLKGLCQQYDFKLTIYVDDITISGGSVLDDKKSVILSILKEMGFAINLKKTKLFRNVDGGHITGIHIKNKSATTVPEFDEKVRLVYLMMKMWPDDPSIRKKLKSKLIGQKNWMRQVDEKKLSRFEKVYESQNLGDLIYEYSGGDT